MPAASDPDRAPAERARRGDREALAALYQRHKGRLLGFLSRMIGDRALAEDVFQDVWMKVFETIASYSPGRGPFRAWIYKVAANAAIDRLRSETLRRAEPLDPAGTGGGAGSAIPSTSPTPEEACTAGELADRLSAVLSGIDERQRVAVLLRHQQGLSYREIAAVFDVAEGTAKTLVHRGILKLRDALEDVERG